MPAAPKIPPVSEEMTIRAVAALREGVQRGPAFDMRNRRTFAALAYLEQALPGAWPVVQFRRALEFENETSRWQNCNAALAGVEIAQAAVMGGFRPLPGKS